MAERFLLAFGSDIRTIKGRRVVGIDVKVPLDKLVVTE
jgi:hypothetical protein